jgi:hypothetical protein
MDFGDAVNEDAFAQILEMDDSPDNRDFSKELVLDFFHQSQNTFVEMDQAL